MHIKLTYPPVERKRFARRKLLNILRWPFVLAAVASVIVNLAVGGMLWSSIVVVGLWSAWSLIFSVDLVEYNRTSQSIKTIVFSCILLSLIDVFIAPGFAVFVVPIVYFGGLIFCAVLLFTDFETQRHNILPLLLFIFFAIIGSAIGLTLWHEHDYWPLIVLGAVAAVLLAAIIIILGPDFKRELIKRFHID
jgi:hypothetical protein